MGNTMGIKRLGYQAEPRKIIRSFRDFRSRARISTKHFKRESGVRLNLTPDEVWSEVVRSNLSSVVSQDY